ncbi:neuronal acetylcholine receptor subunit beta-3 isoform X2 [Nematostella vectensis]|uniref:neuronal acetylcholine receptor subunit beta-3 isoform X2 n=1 Tax=Nematostella vectensis TaxID=45351 RepID=UPI00139020B0|nr:neuronal acetylcholine receptor subunit beta-3 isoform X2 [Nematostella vectensis]
MTVCTKTTLTQSFSNLLKTRLHRNRSYLKSHGKRKAEKAQMGTVFHWTLLCLICYVSGIEKDVNGSDLHEHTLLGDLLKGYNKDAHPVPILNKTQYMVTFGLELVQLVNVDDKNQIITTNVWVRQRWTNLLLKWDPDKYGGITRVRIDASKIWIPDIVLYNSADSEFSGGLEKYKTRVILNHDGVNAWYSPASFRSTCQIDVTFFPFDQQTCFMKFGSWTFEVVDLDIFADKSPLHSSQYMKSAEWDLIAASKKRNVEYYACCTYPFSDVTVTWVFRRKPLFYVFNLIVPCLIITGMVLLGFMLPPESGERITLSITVLLAMAVFLQLAAENLPRNSDNVPVLGIFYITVMVEVALSLIATCYVLHIHHKNSGIAVVPVPHWVQVYMLGYLGKILGVKKPITEDTYDASSKLDFKRLSMMKRDMERAVGDGKRRFGLSNGGKSGRRLGSRAVSDDLLMDSFDQEDDTNSNSTNQNTTNNTGNNQRTFSVQSSMNTKATQGIIVLADHVKHKRLVEINQGEWRYLAMVLDRLFFWLFVLMIILSASVILRSPSISL